MEEAHRVGERILDKHALSVAGDKASGGGICVIGKQDGGLIVAEIGDEELAVGARARTRLLFENTGLSIFAMRDVEGDGAPG